MKIPETPPTFEDGLTDLVKKNDQNLMLTVMTEIGAVDTKGR